MGNCKSITIGKTMPPLAVPSNFDKNTPLQSKAFENSLACKKVFWPKVASKVSIGNIQFSGILLLSLF